MHVVGTFGRRQALAVLCASKASDTAREKDEMSRVPRLKRLGVIIGH